MKPTLAANASQLISPMSTKAIIFPRLMPFLFSTSLRDSHRTIVLRPCVPLFRKLTISLLSEFEGRILRP